MMEPTRTQRIERLLWESVGKLVSHRPVPVDMLLRRLGAMPGDAAGRDGLSRRIYAEHVGLSKLSDEELSARHQVLAENDERLRFFNLPTASADFEYWAKADSWTLEEAVALLLGKSPKSVTWKVIQPWVKVSPFACRYADLRELAQRAEAMGYGRTGIRPADVVRWAERIGEPVPVALTAALEAIRARLPPVQVPAAIAPAMPISRMPALATKPPPDAGAKPVPNESKTDRQDRRLEDCEAAGLVMPTSPVGRLPDGVGKIAAAEGVRRQTLSADVRAALKRRAAAQREGVYRQPIG